MLTLIQSDKVFVMFLHCKVLFRPSPISILLFLKGSCFVWSIFKEWGVLIPLLKGGVVYKIIQNSSAWKNVSSPPFTFFFLSIQIHDTYFILWFIIQYYYFVAQMVPALAIGNLLVGFCVPLTYHHYCGFFFFFSTSLLSALTRCYSSLCIFLAPSSRISHFSKKPCVYTILSHEKLHSRSQPWILIIPFLSSYPTLSQFSYLLP